MIGRRGVSKPTPTADLEALPDREKPATAACCSSRRLLLLAVSALFATLLFREGSAARFPMLTTLEAAPAQMDSDHSLHIAGSINPAAAAAAAAAATTAATSTSASSASATQVLWRPSPDSAGIQEARQAHASLGLVTLGGGESDSFVLGVRPSTGTVEVVSPASLPLFSYTLPMKDPSVRLHWGGSGRHPLPLDRSAEGFHHLGDVTMRVRLAGSNGRFSAHSTVSRAPPLATAQGGDAALRVSPDGLNATVDATLCLQPRPPVRLKLTRSITVQGTEAIMSLRISNEDLTRAVEIGGLGFSMPMNQMFSGRSLPEVARRCSFTEVYLGGDAGYVQVTRTTGEGPVLLVMPLGRPTAGGSASGGSGGSGDNPRGGFEGWRPLKWEDRANYDWMHEMVSHAARKGYGPRPYSAIRLLSPSLPLFRSCTR